MDFLDTTVILYSNEQPIRMCNVLQHDITQAQILDSIKYLESLQRFDHLVEKTLTFNEFKKHEEYNHIDSQVALVDNLKFKDKQIMCELHNRYENFFKTCKAFRYNDDNFMNLRKPSIMNYGESYEVKFKNSNVMNPERVKYCLFRKYAVQAHKKSNKSQTRAVAKPFNGKLDKLKYSQATTPSQYWCSLNFTNGLSCYAPVCESSDYNNVYLNKAVKYTYTMTQEECAAYKSAAVPIALKKSRSDSDSNLSSLSSENSLFSKNSVFSNATQYYEADEQPREDVFEAKLQKKSCLKTKSRSLLGASLPASKRIVKAYFEEVMYKGVVPKKVAIFCTAVKQAKINPVFEVAEIEERIAKYQELEKENSLKINSLIAAWDRILVEYDVAKQEIVGEFVDGVIDKKEMVHQLRSLDAKFVLQKKSVNESCNVFKANHNRNKLRLSKLRRLRKQKSLSITKLKKETSLLNGHFVPDCDELAERNLRNFENKRVKINCNSHKEVVVRNVLAYDQVSVYLDGLASF